MSQATFKTNPIGLYELLRLCEKGDIQLPDFQRSWVWDDDRIKSLIASISQAFPVGALMTLETGGDVNFSPRLIQGAPETVPHPTPRELLLDGQQRMTSLYQTCLRKEVVHTITAKKKAVSRWYYIDIEAALNQTADREEAIVGVPEDRIVRENFGKDIRLDLSTPTKEFTEMMFPVNQVFDWDEWQDGFSDHWYGENDYKQHKETFKRFKDGVLQNFKSYHVPVIELARSTTKEAVCLVFEKVNTGGKALDAFELVTAIYASDGYELRKDWLGEGTTTGRYPRLRETSRLPNQSAGILQKVGSTDFLQVVSLLHTKERRLEAVAQGKVDRELPPASATRQSLLNLPLDAYKKYADSAEEGFVKAAKFLHMQKIYKVLDLPYQSQVVPLAAILADIGKEWEHEAIRHKIALWYWCGVLGELYGSAAESRFARDIMEVPAWLNGEKSPSTITDATFRADRLLTMRSRLSAAYKGVNALLMKTGAKDFRSGQDFDHTIFFNENVDIHHIFPRDWCKKQDINRDRYDSIINKTPLSARTNRILGGIAPSSYLARLENGTTNVPSIPAERLLEYLGSHLIDPDLLKSDNFDAFFAARQEALLNLIEEAMGIKAYRGTETDEQETDATGDEFEDE